VPAHDEHRSNSTPREANRVNSDGQRGHFIHRFLWALYYEETIENE
jgi:hypothetical protein